MQKDLYSGKLIVFEGLDASGKSTQQNLLARRLKKEGCKAVKVDFPRYGGKSAGLVEEYLGGKYGSSEAVGPYRASIFYACDRYSASFKIREWLKQGKIVIADRYVASNIGHQGGKIKNEKERDKFIKWVCELEYNIFQIPKPDLIFILKTSSKLSYKMAPAIIDKKKKERRKLYLKNTIRDIHERDLNHLTQALEAYLFLAKRNPREFKVIECIKDKKLLPPAAIHQEIWKIVSRIL